MLEGTEADHPTAETQQKSQAAYNQGRIAKPLRGGGGGSVSNQGQQSQAYQQQQQRAEASSAAPGQPLYQTLAAGNNAVSRLQGEESGKRRELERSCKAY